MLLPFGRISSFFLPSIYLDAYIYSRYAPPFSKNPQGASFPFPPMSEAATAEVSLLRMVCEPFTVHPLRAFLYVLDFTLFLFHHSLIRTAAREGTFTPPATRPAALSPMCPSGGDSFRRKDFPEMTISRKPIFPALFVASLLLAGNFSLRAVAKAQSSQSTDQTDSGSTKKKKKSTDDASADSTSTKKSSKSKPSDAEDSSTAKKSSAKSKKSDSADNTSVDASSAKKSTSKTKKSDTADSAAADSSTTKKSSKSKKADTADASGSSASSTPAADASVSTKSSKSSKSKKSAASDSSAAAAPAATSSSTPAAAPTPASKTPPAATNSSAKPAASQQTPPANSNGMVWVNTDSGVYHKPGSRYYGKTKQGKYMTEADAIKAGYRASEKN